MRTKPAKKTCHKVEYPNKAAARQALNDFGRERGAKRYYRCKFHQGREVWHLTSESAQ